MKYYFYLIGALMLLFSIIWTFNHVNPWISILLVVISIGFIVNILQKQIKL